MHEGGDREEGLEGWEVEEGGAGGGVWNDGWRAGRGCKGERGEGVVKEGWSGGEQGGKRWGAGDGWGWGREWGERAGGVRDDEIRM